MYVFGVKKMIQTQAPGGTEGRIITAYIKPH